jgi:periplasmic protein TonB
MKAQAAIDSSIFNGGPVATRSGLPVLPGVLSLAAHLTILTLALIPWVSSVKLPKLVATEVVLYTPTAPLILPTLPGKSGGGGGGGMRTPMPASFGRPPRGADKQITPPTPEAKNMAPELIAEPTIVAPQLASLPQFSLLPIGDVEGIVGPPSAGRGSGGGIGDGKGHGDGPGDGDGAGPGNRWGAGGRDPGSGGSSGGSLTMPVPIFRPDPAYSEDARKARFQGIVTLQTVIHKDGSVEVVRVVGSPGYGLDQEAIKAVRQWRFKPGTRNGQPTDFSLSIEVSFRIL